MAKKQKNQSAEAVVEALSKTEKFFTDYKKHILYSLLAIVILVGGGFAYYKFVHEPANKEAQEQMIQAENYFSEGNYDAALNGDGNALGFAEIAETYGNKAGRSVYLYAGICELANNNYEQAISYLKSYKGKDAILKARALSCIGDAYTGLEDYTQAIKYFEKAAKVEDNIYAAAYLLRAGIASEKLDHNDAALKYYKQIKDKYPHSMEAYTIDKYISRIEAK